MLRASGPLNSVPGLPPEPDEAPATLDVLYRRHAGWLRTRLRTRFGALIAARADDLVQETYARAAAQGAGAIRHPRAFLLSVASRLAIDVVRAARREGEAPSSYGESASQPDQDAQLLLKQIILALPPTCVRCSSSAASAH